MDAENSPAAEELPSGVASFRCACVILTQSRAGGFPLLCDTGASGDFVFGRVRSTADLGTFFPVLLRDKVGLGTFFPVLLRDKVGLGTFFPVLLRDKVGLGNFFPALLTEKVELGTLFRHAYHNNTTPFTSFSDTLHSSLRRINLRSSILADNSMEKASDFTHQPHSAEEKHGDFAPRHRTVAPVNGIPRLLRRKVVLGTLYLSKFHNAVMPSIF